MDRSAAPFADHSLVHTEPTDLETIMDPADIELESAEAAPLASPSLAHTEPTDVETVTVQTGSESRAS